MIDGAVLVNLPAQSAIEAIIHQPSRERIERVLALVVPDPGELVGAATRRAHAQRGAQQEHRRHPEDPVADRLRPGAQRAQPEVRSRRWHATRCSASSPTSSPAAAWAELANVAEACSPRYRATRVAMSVDRLASASRPGCPRAPPPSTWRPSTHQSRRAPVGRQRLALGGVEWCWGSAPVRRLAAVLITWINTVAAVARPMSRPSLYAVKEKVGRTRADGRPDLPQPGHLRGAVRRGARRRDGVSVADAFERASRRWPTDDPAAAARDRGAERAARALATCFGEFVAAARSTIESRRPILRTDQPVPALRGLVRLHDGAAPRRPDPTPLCSR